MPSKVHHMRRFSNRLKTENARLYNLSHDMRAAGFPLLADEVHKLAVKAGTMGLSLSFTADTVRDERGAAVRR